MVDIKHITSDPNHLKFVSFVPSNMNSFIKIVLEQKTEERLIHGLQTRKLSWILNPASLSLNFFLLQRSKWPKTIE